MSKVPNIASWAFRGIISFIILYYLFLKIPFNDVITSLSNAHFVWLLLAVLLQLAMIFINSLQMKIFVHQQKMNLRIPMLIKINFITFFYKLFLPGELVAGIVRWRKLSKPNGMRAQALACIILARVINIFTLAFVGIVFFSIEKPYTNSYISISLLLGFLGAFLIFLSITNTTFSLRIENIARRLNTLAIPPFIQEKTIKVWNSLKEFHKISSSRKVYALSLAASFHLIQAFSLLFFMYALDIRISFISIAWIMSAIFFLQMLPVSISGLGVREGAFVFFLKEYGILGSAAIALSFLILGASLIFALFGGIFEATEFFKQDKIKGGN